MDQVISRGKWGYYDESARVLTAGWYVKITSCVSLRLIASLKPADGSQKKLELSIMGTWA